LNTTGLEHTHVINLPTKQAL